MHILYIYIYIIYIYILGAALASLSVGSLGSPMLITKFIWSTRKLLYYSQNAMKGEHVKKLITGIARATHKNYGGITQTNH